MKIKKNYFDYFFNYRFLEFINYFGILTENIFMIIFYSKSIEESIENYNKIDNRLKFKKFSIIIGSVHIFIIIIIFFAWIISRYPIEYLYAIKKYKIENSIKFPIVENKEIKLFDIIKLNIKKEKNIYIDEKSKLNIDINRYCQKDIIEIFFEYIKFSLKKLNIERLKEFFLISFYISRTIYPFYITLICLILFLIGW
jgi:hypothetical protein